jgi:hypothetical protein
MHLAHARDRRRGHLEDLPQVREIDELRAIERREIDHLAVVKEFEDATTAVDDDARAPTAPDLADVTDVELEEIEDDVDPR